MAEQMNVATRPDMTYWSLGGVMMRGGWPVMSTTKKKEEEINKLHH